MNEVSDSIKQGLEEALAYSRGEADEAIVHIPTEIDVQRIRTKLELSQADFAACFGVNVRTIQDWEQGRRVPSGASRNFLHVIDREPEAVRRALMEEA